MERQIERPNPIPLDRPLRLRLRQQQPPDPEMDLSAQGCRDQFNVPRSCLYLPAMRVDKNSASSAFSDTESLRIADVAETAQLLQCALGLGRQAGQLSGHKVGDILGVTLAIEIPAPARRVMIEDCRVCFSMQIRRSRKASA